MYTFLLTTGTIKGSCIIRGCPFACCSFQQSVDVGDLIEESYRRFGTLTNHFIGQLRLKYRLQVVQTIEDHTMKNILRSVSEKSMIKGKELEDLYMLFKVELQ